MPAALSAATSALSRPALHESLNAATPPPLVSQVSSSVLRSLPQESSLLMPLQLLVSQKQGLLSFQVIITYFDESDRHWVDVAFLCTMHPDCLVLAATLHDPC
jgi:hypothetical protein